ncbi:hypothetical protein [Polynucleobacter asymbioticus]|jgi:hypothetical protein|uniref:DUF721 domain-containing protein n=2 Tax=Polynucleobacter asymbioticus TaxID=576611 RepID=A4SV82_POLAQ|nr:hypothetical protein [Polynucleobacter asymbioticus]ABP33396.1 hypothetical protein Pnuc_0175 [Polynucleobacter asymbioticus QLW-P1DMWA-1]APB98033.1 hypothetical protein A4F89_01105 [Polynucleobacter asymbioticus]APC00319.1 hypothetical protein AOC25_01110 [Polynucleobacter asymbioticus]APC05196.1 hypothetical protein AOC10_00940 [Polynucleobacter asymbioticus]
MNFAAKPSRKQTAHEWVDYLRESDGLGGILAKTEDLARLRSILGLALAKTGLDHLLPKIEAGWRSGGQNELFLLVGSASIASRLQQTLPSIIKELDGLGLQCSAIKVRVKPAPPSWEVKSRAQDQKNQKPQGFNEVAKKSWKDLLDKLSPDSELYKTVQKLLQSK